MKEKKKEGTVEQKIYVVLLIAGIIALASLTLLYGRKTDQREDIVEQNIELDDPSPVSGQVSTEGEEQTKTAADATEENQTLDQSSEENTKSQETASVKQASYNGKDKLIWPVSGSILIPYSMDTTVYFETLDQYQCNPGLYIQADKGTKVKSIYEGTVTRVKKDSRLGKTVTVDLGNGYSVTYGQLKNLTCKKGDYVETGSVIGKVAEPTSYFTLEGTHLYVKMTKDKKPVNPTDYFES
ncbi:MAG: M23 family metallopeptidase [Lachnospiraceae bacterium]|nr:M23 family metallopeptidase [Lachnospiraceae bacterium]